MNARSRSDAGLDPAPVNVRVKLALLCAAGKPQPAASSNDATT